ncbi:MAG: exo-alpha-sialidase [Sedimentisphaerales bacterium]|nr:exo-alpha-sialidase [Sedimentisphaerales bacterium]
MNRISNKQELMRYNHNRSIPTGQISFAHKMWLYLLVMTVICSLGSAADHILFEDTFQTYDVEEPADFSVGGVPSGSWFADFDPAVDRATEIYNTGNFGGTRLWVSIDDGASITSKGIEGLQSGKKYSFAAVLVAETSSPDRTAVMSYDLLVGQNAAAAETVISGPVTVTVHGDDWQIADSKSDHVFTREFTTGLLNAGDRLFIKMTRISSPDAAYIGVDDVRLAEVQPIEIITSDTALSEGSAASIVYDIYVKNGPAEPVSVTVLADDQVRVNGQPEVTLLFTPPVDPAVSQKITVSAVDDTLHEGTHTGLISHVSSSILAEYNGLHLPAVEVTIADDDLPVNFVSSVFVGGQEGPSGTSNYRIPGMTVAPDGSILAFAEGRRNGGDPGATLPIDMVMKRSTDHGKTWQPLVVLHQSTFDYSDPRPVTDMEAGKVHLLYTQWPDLCGQGCVPAGLSDNSSVMFLQTSVDNGLTWSGPINLNTQVKNPTWKALNSGPGHGIQLRWQSDPARNGRLLDPAHINGADAVSVYSDDGGQTWQSGTVDVTAPSLNESDVVELTNGDLLWDARPGSGLYRYWLKSTDGGQTWQYQGPGDIYITTVDCGIERFSAKRDGHDRDRIVFSGPLGSPVGSASGRYNMAIWTSYDEGESFTNPVQINNGFAAYSDIKRLADGSIGVIYEETGSTLIRLASCSIEALENGPHDKALTQYEGFGNAVDARRGGVGWKGSWSGLGEFTRKSSPTYGGSSLPFTHFRFNPQVGRLDASVGGLNLVRQLSSAVDTNAEDAVYLSILISRAMDNTSDDPQQEDLTIELRDQADAPHIAFGVTSDEQFIIVGSGEPTITAPDTFLTDRVYFLVAKIVFSQPHDRLYLKAFQSGRDVIPINEADVAWTLTGTATETINAVLDRIGIVAGPQAMWSIDELRIGTTYEAVAGRSDCSAEGTFLNGDINRDCYVNLADLVLLSQDWLACSDPHDPLHCSW